MRGGNLLRQFVDFKNVVFFNCVEQQPSARVITAAEFAPEGVEGGVPRIEDSLFALLTGFFGSQHRHFKILSFLLEVLCHSWIIGRNFCAVLFCPEPLSFPESFSSTLLDDIFAD